MVLKFTAVRLDRESGTELHRQGVPTDSGVKNPPANAGDMGSIPGSRRSPGEGNGILAWKIPWTEEPGGLEAMGSQRLRHN